MEKGKLIKNLDLTKYKYPYVARRSHGKSVWLVEACRPQHEHSILGFVGKVTMWHHGELQRTKMQDQFLNIFQAFVWADNQVDYKHEVFKDVYVQMLMKGE